MPELIGLGDFAFPQRSHTGAIGHATSDWTSGSFPFQGSSKRCTVMPVIEENSSVMQRTDDTEEWRF